MTDDKMPPLPAYVYGRETAANERMIPLGDAEAWRNAARAYAAEQVRELVEALHELIEGAESMLGTCGVIRGDTPEDSDTFLHDDWAEQFLTERTVAARALIAKHKGTP
jgi:hypothetical protein